MTWRGTDPLPRGLAAGSEQAFAELYDRFGARLYHAALAMLHRREDAEDAVQEVFLAMVRSRKRLADVRDLTAYLFAALRRAAARRAARRSREAMRSCHAGTEPAAPSPSDGPDPERLRRALHALPPEQRDVIALKIDAGLSFAQVAEVMGVSINTAASRYRYALEKLRDRLKE
jgi:RNA polymerase sigma-70 factor (ECF subfamily)